MVANGCMLSKLVEMEKSIVSNLDWWPKRIPKSMVLTLKILFLP